MFPLIEVTRGELTELAGEPITRTEPVNGGLTNTLHKVWLASGSVLVIKHHAGGPEPFQDEVATIARLAGILPVPEVVRTDTTRRAIVYRWVEGITIDECRRKQPPAAFASLAEPLGRFLAWLATVSWTGTWDVAPLLARARLQLTEGRARQRLGAPTADVLAAALADETPALAWGTPCLSHGDLGGRNMIVQHAMGDRWRIGGVIDWEAAACASPLVDLGSVFRDARRYDAAFLADFERGYREADGALPDRWFHLARLLDALSLVDLLDEDRELPGVFAECRMLIAHLVADVRG
ncbi:MAG: aminoglycoside phosphotransferase family protein [Myxococcota bacterium]|nr:aminoglycoside phosphotransferase family protein [Myxococcota bacterium]